jgi:transposase InsO family protein
MRFIEERKDTFGVEPICRVLDVSSSSYYAHRSRGRSMRDLRDDALVDEITRARRGRRWCYGARKTWKQLKRDGVTDVGRERVARVMRREGLRGVRRGRFVVTTRAEKDADRARDLVERQFAASRPDELWVGDFTYVALRSGFCYLAFILDVYSRRVVGWNVATSMRTELVLDALLMAYALRQPAGALIAHTDRGSQYTSIAYTTRVAEYQITPSVGSVGDAYDNAMAESWVATYKSECVQKQTYPSATAAELDALDYIGFYNLERLHESLGDIPPIEYEQLTHETLVSPVAARRLATVGANSRENNEQTTSPDSTLVDGVSSRSGSVLADNEGPI